MNGPPFYPTWLVRLNGYSRGNLGAARMTVSGWTFRFGDDGSLTVATPASEFVLNLGGEETERFVDLVRALDAGRYSSADFAVLDK